ncbi:MAG: hypothetical protein ACXWC8_19640 [Limisphaerales bacterium]
MDNATNNSSFSHERIKVLLYVEDDDNDCRMFLRAARKLSARLDVRTGSTPWNGCRARGFSPNESPIPCPTWCWLI